MPPAFTKDAVIEAIDAEIPLLVVITEGVPVQDSAEFWAYAKEQGKKTRIIGPNCPGIITPASRSSASPRRTSRARARSASSRSRAR